VGLLLPVIEVEAFGISLLAQLGSSGLSSSSTTLYWIQKNKENKK